MLMVFYGLTLSVGDKTRQYMRSQGFRVIEKAVIEDENTPVKSYYTPRTLSDKSIIDSCDFKYRTNYGYAGFNKADIFDAIYGNENAILCMTSENIEFLHHIQAGYGDAVPIVGVYIDKNTQRELIQSKGLCEAEAESRLAMGDTVAKVIVNNRALFDYIMIYGGEKSNFDFSSLTKQLDVLIEKSKERQKRFLDSAYIEAPYQGSENYVFMSYSHLDRTIAGEFLAFLQFHGVRVWYDAGIPVGDNWRNVIADKLEHASAVILLCSKNSTASDDVKVEIARATQCKKKILRVRLDDSEFDIGIEMYLQAFSHVSINEIISYENKVMILDSLAQIGVKSDTNRQVSDSQA